MLVAMGSNCFMLLKTQQKSNEFYYTKNLDVVFGTYYC